MTREQARLALPIIQAFADGEIIQTRSYSSGSEGKWHEYGEEISAENVEYLFKHPECYRIKPKLRELWLVYDSCGKYEDVGQNHHHFPGAFHVREVEP